MVKVNPISGLFYGCYKVGIRILFVNLHEFSTRLPRIGYVTGSHEVYPEKNKNRRTIRRIQKIRGSSKPIAKKSDNLHNY